MIPILGYSCADFDSDCGQTIACDILPKYLSGKNLENCYLEVSRIVMESIETRATAQRDDTIRRLLIELEKCIKHTKRSGGIMLTSPLPTTE